jgi:hypothetical protein
MYWFQVQKESSEKLISAGVVVGYRTAKAQDFTAICYPSKGRVFLAGHLILSFRNRV